MKMYYFCGYFVVQGQDAMGGHLLRLKLVESKSYVHGYFLEWALLANFIQFQNHGQFHAMLIHILRLWIMEKAHTTRDEN